MNISTAHIVSPDGSKTSPRINLFPENPVTTDTPIEKTNRHARSRTVSAFNPKELGFDDSSSEDEFERYRKPKGKGKVDSLRYS